VQTNLASPPARQGRMHQLQGEHTSKAGLAQEEKGGQNQAPADTGPRDAVGPSGGNRENLPPQSYFRLYTHIAPYSTLFRGHDAGNRHVGSRRPHQWGHSSLYPGTGIWTTKMTRWDISTPAYATPECWPAQCWKIWQPNQLFMTTTRVKLP